MGPELALVTVPTWQWVLLMVLCFGSLIIGLYCLLFMVPLKSFVERINSLGGGMKGIRTHVDGVKSETEQQIVAAQEHMEERLSEAQTGLRDAIESVADTAGQAHEAIVRLDRAAQSLQAAVRENAADARDLSASLGAAHKELEELKSDFAALHAELRGSVSRMVGEYYQRVEGTVLSALETVKDEMLRGAGPRPPRDRSPSAALTPASPFSGPRPPGSRQRSSSKIIEGGSLFAGLEKVRGSETAQEEEGGQPRQGEQQPAPAK